MKFINENVNPFLSEILKTPDGLFYSFVLQYILFLIIIFFIYRKLHNILIFVLFDVLFFVSFAVLSNIYCLTILKDTDLMLDETDTCIFGYKLSSID